MISNEGLSGAMFGTGRLLDDLIQFVYSGTGCRLLLMGDTAQLPPVGEELSPALFTDALKGYGLEVREVDLTQVVRQVQDSGILWNATRLRELIAEDECYSLPKIRISGFADIKVVPGEELIDTLTACYERDGMDETIVVCRSNKRANIYNKGIRAQILYREDELNTGDMLMVAKNNYYWTEKSKEMDFIANGEIAVVRRVRRTRELYEFRFAEVVLTFPDHEDFELEANLLLDTLHSDAPALPKTENDRLFYSVLEDYVDIPVKCDRMKKMKMDPHYNALLGIRRAVVQDELRFALVVLHELVVQVVVVPILEHDRFLLGQAGAHLKQGLGQIQSTVVLRLILSHWFYTLLYWFCSRKQRSYALILSKQLYGTQMMPCCRCLGNYSLKLTP